MKSVGGRQAERRVALLRGEDHASGPAPSVSTPNMTGGLAVDDGHLGEADLFVRRWVAGVSCRGAHWASLVGRRKIARISGGAAMNSTISDWTTSTMSTGMFWDACIAKPPALKAPNSRPAAQDAERFRAAQQRDGDGVEADAGVEVDGDAAGDGAEHLVDARPGRRAHRR